MEKKGFEADRIFRTLGDKNRIRILDLLMEQELNAGELLEKVDIVQSTLSHHMKALCESGLVLARKAGKWTYYAVDPEAVEAAREFLERYLMPAGAAGSADPAQTKEKGRGRRTQPRQPLGETAEEDGGPSVAAEASEAAAVSADVMKQEPARSPELVAGLADDMRRKAAGEHEDAPRPEIEENAGDAANGVDALQMGADETGEDIWGEDEAVPTKEAPADRKKPAESRTRKPDGEKAPGRSGSLYFSMQDKQDKKKKSKPGKSKKTASGKEPEKKKNKKDSEKKKEKKKGSGKRE